MPASATQAVIQITSEKKRRILAAVRALHWYNAQMNLWSIHGSGVVLIRNGRIYLIFTLHSLSVSELLCNPSDQSLSEVKISIQGFHDDRCARLSNAAWRTIAPDDRYDEEKDFIAYEIDCTDSLNMGIITGSCYAALPIDDSPLVPEGANLFLCGYTKETGADSNTILRPQILPCIMEHFDSTHFRCRLNQDGDFDLDGCSGGGVFAYGGNDMPILVGLIQMANNNIVRGISFPLIKKMLDEVCETPIAASDSGDASQVTQSSPPCS